MEHGTQKDPLRQQSVVDIPPELPKPVEPPPKSPPPVVFVLPKPVLPVEPNPVPSEEDTRKLWIHAVSHSLPVLRRQAPCARQDGREGGGLNRRLTYQYSCLLLTQIHRKECSAVDCYSGRSRQSLQSRTS